ncbi:MAG: glycosyltransferase, partial [Bacteroidota bacterium]
VVIEAMAADCPVVSTSCPWGPPEIIKDDEFGLLSPIGEVEPFAANMLKMVKDKDLQKHYATKGLERAQDFDISVIGSAYEQALLKLLP